MGKTACQPPDHEITKKLLLPTMSKETDLILLRLQGMSVSVRCSTTHLLSMLSSIHVRWVVYNDLASSIARHAIHRQQNFENCEENDHIRIRTSIQLCLAKLQSQDRDHKVKFKSIQVIQAESKNSGRISNWKYLLTTSTGTKMCRSFTISYTRCGHEVRHPFLCQAAGSQKAVYPCRGWDNPMREFLQAEDAHCPRCEEQPVPRITQTPWRSSENDNLQQDVPIRSRRGSLPQRYVPTPPPAYTRGYEYVSGYGYGESQSRGARGDPDPSPNEVQRRVSEWARRVPAGPPPASLARTERELYRPLEHDRARTVSSSSHHYDPGVQSHAPRHRRRQSDIYDPRRSHTGNVSRAELESDQSTHYIRATDEERRNSQSTRRPRHPPSVRSVADSSAFRRDDDFEFTATRHLVADGMEFIETITYGSEHQSVRSEDISTTHNQTRGTEGIQARAERRGRGIYGGSGGMAYLRGPQPPHPPHRL